jgi:ABC-type spermidine/putrescine transport system permease subunit I
MQKLIASIASRLVIAVPYLWLLVFFLVPFFIVFKISLSQVAMSIPPYVPTFGIAEGLAANWAKIKQLVRLIIISGCSTIRFITRPICRASASRRFRLS